MISEDTIKLVDRYIKILYYLDSLLVEMPKRQYKAYEKIILEDWVCFRDNFSEALEARSPPNVIINAIACLNNVLYVSFYTLQKYYIENNDMFFRNYSSKVKEKVFDDYYSRYFPEATRIQSEIKLLDEIRIVQMLSLQPSPSFEDMLRDTVYLRRINNKINIPAFYNEINKLRREERMKDFDKRIGYLTGVAFIIAIMVLAIYYPNPTLFQYNVFRIVLSISIAGFASIIPGLFQIKFGNWLKAGGALAVFAFVYSYNPAQLVSPPPKPIKAAKTIKSDTLATDTIR